MRLDLVNRLQLNGKTEVQRYFTNYAKASPRHFELGFVDGHPAMLVFEAAAPAGVWYFIVLEWTSSSVAGIRDFLYAPYALDGAVILDHEKCARIQATQRP